MKRFLLLCTIITSLLAPIYAAQASPAHNDQPHEKAYELSDHAAIGLPAAGAVRTRTIAIDVSESTGGTMRFNPDAITIEQGEVVRFLINNTGEEAHEFFLGSFDEIAKHQRWMRGNHGMRHDAPNSVTIPSGATANLDWTFSDIANLEFACLIPGHREAGMWGVIIVHDHLAPSSLR